MQAWTLGAPRPTPAQAAMDSVIAAVARPHFAAAVLAALEGAVGAASWAVYRLRPQRPPTMHLSASRGVRRRLYRSLPNLRSPASPKIQLPHERRQAST